MRKLYLFILILIVITSCGEYEKPSLVERSLEERMVLSRSKGEYQIETEATSYEVFGKDGSNMLLDGQVSYKPTNDYQVFKAIADKDTFYLGERNLCVEGVPNLRDIGGLFTKDGYQVKWGKLFRSGKLSEVAKGEYDRLVALNLKTICDFRSSIEKAEDPDQWPNIEAINAIALPVGEDESKSKIEWVKALLKEDFDANTFMLELNKGFVRKHADKYKQFFQVLLDEDNYPLLFHCSAGKDRAGFGAYLVLSALGVDMETKHNEYLLSNFYLQHTSESAIKKASEVLGMNQGKLRALMSVKPEYIQAALDAIKEAYGDVPNFLCQGLGMCETEIEQLKHIMLYNYRI